ncbi:hypothetical protein BCR35DRAFT_18677 [Leucosporidium creatinivorum]|uniref:F-box domain-containing protein n=1 Tax=Leucosporidium creatinivorum TaxID=106004 RepID=A0A1Y2D2P3_9BASI|nr:hypothetical protein BCR35DRAFT_18677 [Leucosporidium creatinivorum]
MNFRSWGMRNAYTSSDFLSTTLAALRDVGSLSLGDLGFSFSAILPLLQPLPHLHTLSIRHSNLEEQQGPFHQLTSKSAIDFVNAAVALKSLTLPRQMKDVWTKDELKRVKSAAKKRNVRFDFG